MSTLIDPSLATDDHEPTRGELAHEIARLKAKHDRLPRHFEARRLEVMRDIYALLDQINALPK